MDKEGAAPDWGDLLEQIRTTAESGGDRDVKLSEICRVLKDNIPYYNWVGFYIVDPVNPRELVLGPYAGARTEHVRIAFGKGICGQVAESKETRVVQDVNLEDNYLSCSVDVKSEIVVPVLSKGNFVAELDIDSHKTAPFTGDDIEFLEKVCEIVSPLFTVPAILGD